MKITTIVGARPQFVKAAVVSRAIKRHNTEYSSDPIQETIIHTGQHFDDNMSDVFFRDMDIPRPDHHLNLGGGTHGQMTGRMLEAIEKVYMDSRPDWVLVYGDTNSTLAGALAAAKLHIPVAHVESGLRSYNRKMPEEINRILTDHASTLCFAPTDQAVGNLVGEGIAESTIARVGDVMQDAMIFYRDLASKQQTIVDELKLPNKGFILATAHRAENTDDPGRLAGIIEGLTQLAQELPVVLPLHPRTRNKLNDFGLMERAKSALTLIDPVGYMDMVMLEANAALIATDSGGVQKEAYFNQVPCLTLRDETEWTELLDAGVNRLVGADPDAIAAQGRAMLGMSIPAGTLYGDGQAAEAIIAKLING